MAEEISIDFDVLAQHATRVDQVAADVALAQNAAASINLGGGAFGLMCAFLVPPTSIVSTAAQAAMGAAKGMVERSAREIRRVGRDFTQLEDDIAADIRTIQSELDGGR